MLVPFLAMSEPTSVQTPFTGSSRVVAAKRSALQYKQLRYMLGLTRPMQIAVKPEEGRPKQSHSHAVTWEELRKHIRFIKDLV
jgi:hypothetical protein